MIDKFNIIKKKKIAICIVDNRHLYHSGWATEISINISDFLLHRFISKDYDVYIGKSEDELLNTTACASFYTHAVIVAMGTSTGLSDRLFPAIDKLCDKDFFIAGHILHRNENSYYKNAYYELHHQFYIVNLVEYKMLDFPEVGQPLDEPHSQIEPLRSIGHLYNDHEVAEWIAPGNTLQNYTAKLHGWNIIAEGLLHNKSFIDLGVEIRDHKKYLYYEYDHVFLRHMSSIYHDQLFCNNFYASWNSDAYKDRIPFTGPVEQYITVGIGVYWITYLEKLGVTSDTKVIFTDINSQCLQFMKTMVSEWSGTDYADFYYKNMPILPSGAYRDIEAYIQYTRQEWQKFVDARPDWLVTWDKIKKLNFEFILIDYMGDYDLSWIDKDKRTLLNLSDVFTHSPYTPTQSLKYRIHAENKLFNSLSSYDPNIEIIMTSRAADGFTTHPVTYTGVVGEFALTDINTLQAPPWHAADWKSSKMLGC
jgi:hypothetical protein